MGSKFADFFSEGKDQKASLGALITLVAGGCLAMRLDALLRLPPTLSLRERTGLARLRARCFLNASRQRWG